MILYPDDCQKLTTLGLFASQIVEWCNNIDVTNITLHNLRALQSALDSQVLVVEEMYIEGEQKEHD